jgi:hypothetical protein
MGQFLIQSCHYGAMATTSVWLPLPFDHSTNPQSVPVSHTAILLALTSSWAIRPAFGGIAAVTWIVNTNLLVRALDSREATTSLRFRRCAFAFVVNRNTFRRRIARVTIGFAVTTANRLEFLGANGRSGFAGTLRIGNLALTDAEVAVLPGRAGQPLNGPAYTVLGRWDWRWLVITSGKHKGKTTTD